MLYHEREGKNKEHANFVYIVYLLAKLCNIFDEAFFIDISICSQFYFYLLLLQLVLCRALTLKYLPVHHP